MTMTIFVTTTPCKSHHHGLLPPLTRSGTLRRSDKDDEAASTTMMTTMMTSHTRPLPQRHNANNEDNEVATGQRGRGGHSTTTMTWPQHDDDDGPHLASATVTRRQQ